MVWIFYLSNITLFTLCYILTNQKKANVAVKDHDFSTWETNFRLRYDQQSRLYDKGQISYREFMKNSKMLLEEMLEKREVIKSKYHVSESEMLEYILKKDKE